MHPISDVVRLDKLKDESKLGGRGNVTVTVDKREFNWAMELAEKYLTTIKGE